MQYPLMNASRSYRVSIPELKGGMNLYDSPEYIEDNQIAGGKNLWWMNGALRTRPGLSMKSIRNVGPTRHDVFNLDVARRENSMQQPDYGRYDLVSLIFDNDYVVHTDFISFDGSVTLGDEYNMLIGTGNITCTLIYTNGSVSIEEYGYSPQFILFTSEGKIFMDYQSKDESGMKDITDEAYVPLVMVNGEPQAKAGKPVGTLFEGYNMLTEAFFAWFSSDGEGVYYTLPTSQLDENKPIEITYTHTNGVTYNWYCTYSLGGSELPQTIDGEEVFVRCSWNGSFHFETSDGEKALPEVLRNNITVKAWKKTDGISPSTVIGGMTVSTWFGGDRSGTNSGTRLFLSGNPSYPGLVHWSDINNPLYFPENNYAYIGDKSSQVTAFGKQQNILVIFKEHEMFYAEYVAGTPYTAEDVIEGRVVDVTAYSATFPITPINGYIGCDCPQTVQLCNNHLVWATSDGHVYTLASPNQYNQRNVQAISQMIEPLLKDISYEEWQGGHAVDYRGHYLLQAGNRIFLFNYGDSGFLYINSYYKQETAQRNIAWYMWDISVSGVEWVYTMAREDQMVLLGVSGDNFVYYVLDEEADFDHVNPRIEGYDIVVDDQKVTYSFQTKQFDFGAMERLKTINSVYIWSGESTEAVITYILERGEMQDVNAFLPVSGVSRKTPSISRERTFGMRIEGEGNAEFSGIVINYKMMGGVR